MLTHVYSWTFNTDKTWPLGGEVDIYENWNLATQNHPTFHTGAESDVGKCSITNAGGTGTLLSSNCALNQGYGCTVVDTKGPYGTSDGGVCKSLLRLNHSA